MKPVRRWHDFASGREARRSPYREYWQAVRQSPGAKLAPALRVVAKIAVGRVACLAHIRDMGCAKRLATGDFGRNDAWGSLC
jgi:hypothetical protein